MALGIPLPGVPGDTLRKAFGTGISAYSQLMQPRIQREQLAQQKQSQEAQLAQRIKEHVDNLKIQQMQQARLGQMAPLQQKLAQMQLDKLERESDPLKQLAYMQSLREGLQKMHGQQGAQQSQPMTPFGGMGMPSQQEIESPTVSAPSQESLQHGLMDFSDEDRALMQMSGIKVPKEHIYQGAARNAKDLERLRKEEGEGSPVYQNAKNEYDANIENKRNLSLLRDRTISGLKAGERWIQDPSSGENVGIEHNLSEKERDREIGRASFNIMYPVIYNGAAPFSGEGSIRKLEETASRYNTDPQARKMFDNFLLSEKALTAATVNEAATLGAGKTNQTYKQLRESLEASDVPKKIRSLIKQYQIPASAQLQAAMRFQKLINESQTKAHKMTPATRKLYFNPEQQAQEESQQATGTADLSQMSNEELQAIAAGGSQ